MSFYHLVLVCFDIQYCNRICSGFSSMTNNSPDTLSVILIFEIYNLIWFHNNFGYGWFFLLPITVACIYRSLSLSSSSSLDDSILLTILFSMLFMLFSTFTCLSCLSECSLFKGLVSCILQIWLLIYLAPCLKNNTGPS